MSDTAELFFWIETHKPTPEAEKIRAERPTGAM